MSEVFGWSIIGTLVAGLIFIPPAQIAGNNPERYGEELRDWVMFLLKTSLCCAVIGGLVLLAIDLIRGA